MVYTKEFLISELQRFELENNRNPKMIDMQIESGYPSGGAYTSQFSSWNDALLEAGLEVNKGNLDGTETCDNCGKLKPRQQNWNYKNNQRLCMICNQNLNNHKNGKLDPDSNVGFGFIGQRVVAKTLDLDLKYDCNCSQGFGSEYDLYDNNGYGSINVKTRVLKNNNYWGFNLKNKYIPNTYIMLGFSFDKNDIEHVWITDSADDLIYDDKKGTIKTGISITNSYIGLKRAEPWEVDCEPYNNAYHSMSLENCSILKSD